jgi:hypothetical protein
MFFTTHSVSSRPLSTQTTTGRLAPQVSGSALPKSSSPEVRRGDCAKPEASSGSGVALPFHNPILSELLANNGDLLRTDLDEKTHDSATAGDVVRQTFRGWLDPTVAPLKLGALGEYWDASVAHAQADFMVFQLKMRGSFWQRLFDRQPSLLVQFRLMQSLTERVTNIFMEIKPLDCDPTERARLLKETAPELIRDAREFLHAFPERRSRYRLPCGSRLGYFPVFPSYRPEEEREGRSRNISPGGMKFWAAQRPTASHLCITLQTPSEPEPLRILARVVRAEPHAKGGYEVAVHFPQDGVEAAAADTLPDIQLEPELLPGGVA